MVAVAYLGFVRGRFGPEGVPSSVLRCVRVGARDVQAGEWALRVAWVVTLLADRTDGGADDISCLFFASVYAFLQVFLHAGAAAQEPSLADFALLLVCCVLLCGAAFGYLELAFPRFLFLPPEKFLTVHGGAAGEVLARAEETPCIAGFLCGDVFWRDACGAEAAWLQAEEGLGCFGETEHGGVAQSYVDIAEL